jgi:hypothetical protein
MIPKSGYRFSEKIMRQSLPLRHPAGRGIAALHFAGTAV